MILIKKEIRYFVQKKEGGGLNPDEKERLTESGCLLVTMIEGEGDMEKGLINILINHAEKRNTP